MEKDKIAQFYSSRGVNPIEVFGGEWEEEGKKMTEFPMKETQIQIWKNKEVESKEHKD